MIRYNCYRYPLYNGFKLLLQRRLFFFFFPNVPDIIKSPLSSLLICPTQATGQLHTKDTDKRLAVLELLIFKRKKM